MNSENEKLENNFDENIKGSFKLINDYIDKIKKADYPEDVKKEILNLLTETAENLNSELNRNFFKSEEE